MTQETTFFIIKPDGISHQPDIYKLMRENNLHLDSHHMIDKADLSKLKEHYHHIVDKPFFKDVVDYMQSGPIIVGTLTGDDAVKKWRNLMGATNPKDADEGTIRALFGKVKKDKILNVVHGSDSLENVKIERQIWEV